MRRLPSRYVVTKSREYVAVTMPGMGSGREKLTLAGS